MYAGNEWTASVNLLVNGIPHFFNNGVKLWPDYIDTLDQNVSILSWFYFGKLPASVVW